MIEILASITGRRNFKAYHAVRTCEIAGKTLSGIQVRDTDPCVKCEDRLYLAGIDGRTVLFNGDTAAVSDREGLKCPALDGIDPWEFDVHFASGLLVPCRAETGAFTLGGKKFPAAYAEPAKEFLLVRAETDDGILTLLFDMGRFVVWGSLDGDMSVYGAVEFPYPCALRED